MKKLEVMESDHAFLFKQVFAKPIQVLSSSQPHQIAKWLKHLDSLIKRERARGIAKHYRYNFNRHVALAALRKYLTKVLTNTEKIKGG